MVVENLDPRVTAAMLQGAFQQIGSVLGAGMECDDQGWVKLELAEEAAEAVTEFDGVELAGQAMECSPCDGVQEGDVAGY